MSGEVPESRGRALWDRLMQHPKRWGEFLHEVAHRTGLGRKLQDLPNASRLALEMATHEESERRAMQGELALLEAAWRQAEEIAKIADNLLVPPAVDEFLEKNRSQR